MSYKDYKIVGVEFVDNGNVEDREVLVTLNNGTVVHICACHESWQQYGGDTAELGRSVEVAEMCNDWLHGVGDCPSEDELIYSGNLNDD